MKRTIMAAMVLSLAAGSLALADPPHDHDRGHHGDRHHMVEHDHHAHARFVMSDRYVRPHGYHMHVWRRGERLPPAYRASAYVIPDPVVYRLRPPPRGYYWVRVDNNAVLAAVATGAVIDIAANLFH
ncbi:MAG TPA: RcnB family protein [Steroidobacteraceae bacterium]|nr:RcnB family protein [Steroidobacteraceae bacterium]